jgi:hypothetical protein
VQFTDYRGLCVGMKRQNKVAQRTALFARRPTIVLELIILFLLLLVNVSFLSSCVVTIQGSR